MQVIFEDGQTRLKGVEHFDLAATLDCGQAFRFEQEEPGRWRGIIGRREITLFHDGKDILLSPCTRADYEGFYENYFDLKTDYSAIQRALSKDRYVGRGIAYAPGLRILNQDPYETVISFLISQNNNIKRIKRIIQNLAQRAGERLASGHAFPTTEALAGLEEEELLALGTGYRAKYILGTARRLAEGFCLESLRDMPYQAAKEQLMTLPGVGPKVADCILLFSLGHRESFPVDTWVKKALCNIYPECCAKDAQKVMMEKFGNLAGYANHYLFHCIRNMGEERFFAQEELK